jgi:hypothetical protein
LLTDGTEISPFDAELVRRIHAANVAQVVLVIQQELGGMSLGRKVARAIRRGRLLRAVVFNVVVAIERRIIATAKPEINELFESVPIERVCSAETLRVRPQLSRSGLVHRFSREDIETIRSKKLDLLLRAGSGILRGDILSVARHGVISFHHGDNRTNRGQPPGFWEVFERRDYTGFIIQRLTEELDAGEVLVRGEFATKPSYLLNQWSVYKRAIISMVDLLARLERDGDAGRAPRAEAINWYSHTLYTTPSAGESLWYVAGLLRTLFTRLVRALLLGKGVWELRVLDADWHDLSLARARRLVPPRGKFWADPFIVGHSRGRAIFFEEFDFRRGKAHISALTDAHGGSFSYAGPVIETPYHLSFPYVFRYGDDYYMCPESAESKTIQLWRCTAWPLTWKHHKTLLADVDAVDTMIFERNGLWWLFTNVDRDGTRDYCRELHIYYSDSPLSDNWTPLASNPVVTGAGQARNAGLLFDNGKAYRLAQAQGFDLYGRSLKLFEMTALSDQGYSERLIAELRPDRGLDANGIHHLSACSGAVVFDAYRPRYFWTELRRRLPRKAAVHAELSFEPTARTAPKI